MLKMWSKLCWRYGLNYVEAEGTSKIRHENSGLKIRSILIIKAALKVMFSYGFLCV